jgi:hypothetical protein
VAKARRDLLEQLRHGGAGGGQSSAEADSLAAIHGRARAAFDRSAWADVVAATSPLDTLLASTGALDRTAAETVLMTATAARHQGDHATVERLAARYADASPVPTTPPSSAFSRAARRSPATPPRS